MVQILKNEGSKMKLISESDQITMSECEPDDCITMCGNTVDEKNLIKTTTGILVVPIFSVIPHAMKSTPHNEKLHTKCCFYVPYQVVNLLKVHAHWFTTVSIRYTLL